LTSFARGLPSVRLPTRNRPGHPVDLYTMIGADRPLGADPGRLHDLE